MSWQATIEAKEPQLLGSPHSVQFHGYDASPEGAIAEARLLAKNAGAVPVGKPKLKEITS